MPSDAQAESRWEFIYYRYDSGDQGISAAVRLLCRADGKACQAMALKTDLFASLSQID
jgi:hypothetical protein